MRIRIRSSALRSTRRSRTPVRRPAAAEPVVRSPLQLAYDAVAQLARAATAIAPTGDAKVLRALADRRGVVDRYRAWAAHGRDPSRPLVWMHAPSVGEGLQARPV